MKCWGYWLGIGLGQTNSRGDEANEMGDSLPLVSLGSLNRVSRVSAGGEHTCSLLSDGAVKCWGYNAWGQLGMGDRSDRGDGPDEMGDSLPAVSLW